MSEDSKCTFCGADMAGIDKIYGTQKQYRDLKRWLKKNKPVYLQYLYPEDGYPLVARPISNFTEEADMWLFKNCPLSFVRERLAEQYPDDQGD